jgi:AraC family transcriptional regulator
MNPVQKALWFVESHSREPIALEDIASGCKVSAYHLTRAFAASTGLSLMRYVRARRLSEAAKELAAGADDILRVALNAGYGSHEAFTRAFREQFSLTPEQVRAQGHVNPIHYKEAIIMSSAPSRDLAPPRFETLETKVFAGLVERYDCQAPSGIADQWQRFNALCANLPGRVGKAAYGVVFNFDADGHFDYMCGVEMKSSAELPKGFVSLSVPRQKYAVFTDKGHIAGIRSTIGAIWSDWFPKSGFQSINAPSLERYGPEFSPLTGSGGYEIWVPVKEAGANSA